MGRTLNDYVDAWLRLLASVACRPTRLLAAAENFMSVQSGNYGGPEGKVTLFKVSSGQK
jgi:hypothetical protein